MVHYFSDPIKKVSSHHRSILFPPIFFWLLTCWGLINIAQAYLTPISEDEAYYFMYSRFLAWGYFDHPPMIALFIKIGSLVLNGELGVRLITILAQLACLVIVWTIVNGKSRSGNNVYLFFGIAASMVMFQVFGFFATPDAPLLLFTSLFLFGYNRFLQRESFVNILLLALSMAGMMYSKYHGSLVILFVIISNASISRSWKFWLACSIGALFFLPHILWQMELHFPTLQYHLVTRARPFKVINILEYWPNQLLTFNPFFLGVAVFILFRFRPADLFERALYFISAGFLLFFFAATVRGHIEPHWTTVSSLAMLILVYRRSIESIAIRTYVYRILIPSIVLLFVARLSLIFDILPIGLKLHGQKEWCTTLGSIAGDRPVVFFNSYQHPSLYTYYTGKPATSLDGVSYKKTQYDLWNFDEAYVGKKVILVTGEETPTSTLLNFPRGRKKYIYPVDNFITARKIQISYKLSTDTLMLSGDTITLDATIFNPYSFPIDFHDDRLPLKFQASYLQSGRLKTFSPAIPSPDILMIQPDESLSVNLTFKVPDIPPGNYFFGIVLKAGIIDGTFNSNFISVKVRGGASK